MTDVQLLWTLLSALCCKLFHFCFYLTLCLIFLTIHLFLSILFSCSLHLVTCVQASDVLLLWMSADCTLPNSVSFLARCHTLLHVSVPTYYVDIYWVTCVQASDVLLLWISADCTLPHSVSFLARCHTLLHVSVPTYYVDIYSIWLPVCRPQMCCCCELALTELCRTLFHFWPSATLCWRVGAHLFY
jgi:hypothetical protein